MKHSEKLFNDAKNILVGGVNSPVRAFKGVGGTPIFMKKGYGPYLVSEDEKTYIDYVLSWGPMLLGHADPDVTLAITEAATLGTSFGTPSLSETTLATLIQDFYPGMEKIRLVNSGTEATMSAIRLARGVTKKDLLIKFNGCYHGHSDSLLVAAGSGGLTFGFPDSAGVLADVAKNTIILDYNDHEALTAVFKEKGTNIAAVIIEPVTGNMGIIKPAEPFIHALRALCDTYNSLLIFDEVMCGFRVQFGPTSETLGIKPDITVLGKVIGGGLPCGAYGASSDIMSHLSPEGPVYQAGTLSGNPIVMAAGIATLSKLKANRESFSIAVSLTQDLCLGLSDIIRHKKISAHVVNQGSMWCVFYTDKKVQNLADVQGCDFESFNRFFHNMLEGGVYLAPSQYESCFMSVVHNEKNIQKTLEICQNSM